MAYTADISRTNPACFLFLVDQSGSMSKPLAGEQGQIKMDMAADAINRCIRSTIERCSRGVDINDYFYIGIIGYRTDRNNTPIINSVLPETSVDQPLLALSEVNRVTRYEERVVKVSDNAGGVIDIPQEIPKWLDAHAESGTPMCRALEVAYQAAEGWVDNFPNSFPPIVINVSDGEASDAKDPDDPARLAQRIKDLTTEDGNVLLFNIHLSEERESAVRFPDSEDLLPRGDRHASLMFRMSSVLPDSSRALASEGREFPVGEHARGYVFNADLADLVMFLEIGTRAASNLQ